MSTAYFIVVDQEDPDFNSFVDGKVLTKQLDVVNRIASGLGLNSFEDYACQDLSEFGGPEMEPVWFEASEGANWAQAILNRLRDDRKLVGNADAVIEDLEDYLRVFEEAKARGLKWHLELDF